MEGALNSLRVKHEELLELKEKAHVAEIKRLQDEREEYQKLIQAKVRTLEEIDMNEASSREQQNVAAETGYKEAEAVEKLNPEIIALQRSRRAKKERIGQIQRQQNLFGEGRNRRFDDMSSGGSRSKK